MTFKISKNEFIVQASIQLAGGESAYGGGSISASRVLKNAERLYAELVEHGHILSESNKEQFEESKGTGDVVGNG